MPTCGHTGLILSAAAALYLLNNRFSRIWTFVPIKEITIGVLFAAGTLLGLRAVHQRRTMLRSDLYFSANHLA